MAETKPATARRLSAFPTFRFALLLALTPLVMMTGHDARAVRVSHTIKPTEAFQLLRTEFQAGRALDSLPRRGIYVDGKLVRKAPGILSGWWVPFIKSSDADFQCPKHWKQTKGSPGWKARQCIVEHDGHRLEATLYITRRHLTLRAVRRLP